MPHLPRNLALVLTAAPLAACGGTGSGDDVADVDATPPAETTTITIHAADTQMLAIRDAADADWVALTPGADGDATAEVTGPFEVVSVCTEPTYFEVYTMFGGPTDTELVTYCSAPATAVPVSFTDPALEVYIGYQASIDGSTIDVLPGTYDVVAIDRAAVPERLVIEHDVAITGATTLSFDLAADGVDVRLVPVAATGGDPADSISTAVRVLTKNETFVSFYGDQLGNVPVVPSSALQTDDVETVGAFAYGSGPGSRSATARITGDEPTLAVAIADARITSAAFSWVAAPKVLWQTDGEWQSRYAWAADDSFTRFWDGVVLPGWIAAGGDDSAIAFPDATTLPGWDDRWDGARPAQGSWNLFVSSTAADGGSHAASWGEDFGAARPATPRRALPAPIARRLAR
jgi:hypothetical protein